MSLVSQQLFLCLVFPYSVYLRFQRLVQIRQMSCPIAPLAGPFYDWGLRNSACHSLFCPILRYRNWLCLHASPLGHLCFFRHCWSWACLSILGCCLLPSLFQDSPTTRSMDGYVQTNYGLYSSSHNNLVG